MSTDEEVTKSERIKMELIVITVVIIISLSIIILLLLLAPLFLERIIKKSRNYKKKLFKLPNNVTIRVIARTRSLLIIKTGGYYSLPYNLIMLSNNEVLPSNRN